MANFILKGPPRRAPAIHKGIGEYFFEQAEKFADRVLQIEGVTEKHETYRDVKRRSTKIAIYLRDIGVKPKDIIMLCCKNNLHNIIPALAAQYLGAWVSSVDPGLGVSDVTHLIALTEPKVIFVENDSLELVEMGIQHSNRKALIVTIGHKLGKYPDMLDIEEHITAEEEFKPVKVKSSEIAVILFSSGTTSAPKGIYLSHWALLNGALILNEANVIKVGVLLHFSSLYWISAWILTLVCVATGTAKLVAAGINAIQFLKFVEKYKVSHVFSSNTFTYRLTELNESIVRKYDTSSLFSWAVGGSTMDPNQILRIRRYLPYTNVNLIYGSTEGSYLVAHDYDNPAASREKVMSSGKILPDTQIKFVDIKTGELLGPNQSGEIRIKSDYVMAGYHNYSNPNAFDADGFLIVGDIGYYDEDGYIYIADRISERFKYQTHHISPALLENVILEHPAVVEAISFGVPHFVDQFHAAASVVLRDGFAATPEEIIEFVSSKVSNAYQLRGGVMIVKSIPKTPTGKYQRRVVRDEFIKLNGKRLENLGYNI